jgi:hypothetical protein
MDIHDLLPGQDWHFVIVKMIEDATFFVACLSKNSVNKRGVIQEEIKKALDTKSLRTGMKQLGIIAPLTLRSQPIENLSTTDVKNMLMERNFFDRNKNRSGEVFIIYMKYLKLKVTK